MKQAQFYTLQKCIEQQIEDEIRILKSLIDQMESCPQGIPANQNNAMSTAFNACSRTGWKRYVADLPRRLGLERRMEASRRRLLGLRTVTQPEPA